ncbi:alpha/beta-hydrolase [Jaminaea rosea]|uniref:Alpha/beta-hydrolase n=1 Tax=Jaminaea rosea TaxID=1569628 RepID=A0A316UWJ4_9BASI|nr:alpha/beta-hydrolase [Jaminaea rosea]PWN29659.1 alpha/beta-hydrolase [Jaminaea rosea]
MGLSGIMEDWSPLVEELGLSRRVLIFDHRGIGKSTVPEDWDYDLSFDIMADDLLSLLAELGPAWKTVDMLGFSMGGHILQHLVTREGTSVTSRGIVDTGKEGIAVRKLILAATMTKMPRGDLNLDQMQQEANKIENNEQRKQWTIEELLKYQYDADSLAASQALRERLLLRISVSSVTRRPQQIVGVQAMAISQVRLTESDLSKIPASVPVLVIHGKKDRMVHYAESEKHAGWIKHAKRVDLSDGSKEAKEGHYGHFWYDYFGADYWARKINGWLDEKDQKRGPDQLINSLLLTTTTITLRTPPPTFDALTPPDKGLASALNLQPRPAETLCDAWTAIQDAFSSTASPFESPLGVSSIGSPNSSRDFDESPLLPFDSDFTVGQATSDKSLANFPLFETTTPAQLPYQQQQQQQQQPPGYTTEYEDWQQILHQLYLKHQAEQQAASAVADPQSANQTLIGQFANPSSCPLEATKMGSTFASLADIAPANKPWELPFATADLTRGKSMAESVVSSQESLNGKSSPSATTDFVFSDIGTPFSSQGSAVSPANGTESISQLADIFVREYARTRNSEDTTVLLRALNVAGIAVSDNVLADVGVSSPEVTSTSVASPTKEDFTTYSENGSASSIFDHYFVGHLPHQQQQSYSPPATDVSASKMRSSAQHTAKHSALGGTTPPLQHHGDAHAHFINGKRLFECDVCHKTFDRAFNMKTHRTIHEDTREYPFTCPFADCGKAFARKADCNRHTKSVHLKRGERLNTGPARADLG